jgi:hypothetical protein
MTKQIKITYALFGLSILSVILHNAISAYFKIEEPVFFILTFVFFFLLSFPSFTAPSLILKKVSQKIYGNSAG